MVLLVYKLIKSYGTILFIVTGRRSRFQMLRQLVSSDCNVRTARDIMYRKQYAYDACQCKHMLKSCKNRKVVSKIKQRNIQQYHIQFQSKNTQTQSPCNECIVRIRFLLYGKQLLCCNSDQSLIYFILNYFIHLLLFIKTPSFNHTHNLQVVVVSLGYLIVSGYTYSLQFDAGGTFDGHLPGLQQGWLFGRRIVRRWIEQYLIQLYALHYTSHIHMTNCIIDTMADGRHTE